MIKGFGVDPDASRSAALTVLARYSTGASLPEKGNTNGDNISAPNNGDVLPQPKVKSEKPRPASLNNAGNTQLNSSLSPKSPIMVSPGLHLTTKIGTLF